MFVTRRIPWKWTLYYAWPSMLYFLAVAIVVHELRVEVYQHDLEIPFEPVTILGTALAIFLGFKNNEAYGRWWEARIIWGLAVNYSRAWGRQVLTLVEGPPESREEVRAFQRILVRRHIALVHAMRVYLRSTRSFPQERVEEPIQAPNDYDDCRPFLSREEYEAMVEADNPPDKILQFQGLALRDARRRGWIDEYVHVHLDRTLVEFNNIQGRSERIKKTPLPRPYSYFQRLIVHVHGTLLPLAIVAEVGWLMIPLSFSVSFVFLVLDWTGARTEDPFENRLEDTPLSNISRTIERNLQQQLGEVLSPPLEPKNGVLL